MDTSDTPGRVDLGVALDLCVSELALHNQVQRAVIGRDETGPLIRLDLRDETGTFSATISKAVVADLLQEASQVLKEEVKRDTGRATATGLASARILLQDAVEVIYQEIWLLRHNEPLSKEYFYDI